MGALRHEVPQFADPMLSVNGHVRASEELGRSFYSIAGGDNSCRQDKALQRRAPGVAGVSCRVSNYNAFDFVQRDFIARPVVELGRTR